jgi:DNA-directed RNA polymerase specialized sigma24 family protein
MLLAHLDPDRELAGEKHEQIRYKLAKFFECRGCLHAEDHAEETLNRVAKKYEEGAAIQDPIPYSFGVARMVFKELLKERGRERSMLNQLFSVQPKEEAVEPDSRLDCFEECLGKLPNEDHDMMIEYYQGERHAKIENRRKLAARMAIPLNTLRIRAHRNRIRIEQCIRECLTQNLNRRNPI